MSTASRLLREAMRLDRASLHVTGGLRYAAGVGAPLLLGVAVNRVIEGVAVSTGSLLVGLTDSGAPYRRRVPAMLIASLVVGSATLVGELVGAHDVLTVVILALASFATGLCISAGPWTYLVALMGPIAFVAAASVPTDGPHALGRAALVSGGGLLQVALVVLAWRVDPLLPERVAIARVFRSVAIWLARGRTVDDRAPVFLAIARAHAVLRNGSAGERPLSTLTGLADRIFDELALLRSDREWWDESDLEVRRSSGSGSRGVGSGRRAVVEALDAVADKIARPGAREISTSLASTDHGASATEQRLSDIVADVQRSSVLASGLPHRRRSPPRHDSSRQTLNPRHALATSVAKAPAAIRRLVDILGANLTLRSVACRHAVRLAVAATIASAFARALDLPHDYWVPLTVLWLLRPDFGSTFTRGVQRYAGTTAGAVLATLFAVAVQPGPYALSILATALSVGIFSYMLANYALVGACTTGWVVFVSSLAGIPELHAAADRVLDTSVGAVLALGGYLLWPTWERGDVGAAVADVIDAARRYAAAVLDSWIAPDQSGLEAIERCRADARVTRTNTEAILARSIAEPANSPTGLSPDVASDLLMAVRRFCDGPLALEQSLDDGETHGVAPATRTFMGALDGALDTLAGAARSTRPVDTPAPFDRLRDAHRAVASELDVNDPLQPQAEVMIAAIHDGVVALHRLIERPAPESTRRRAPV